VENLEHEIILIMKNHITAKTENTERHYVKNGSTSISGKVLRWKWENIMMKLSK
jgi:hypothetical protein